MNEETKEQLTIDDDSIDVLNLPPRSTIHHTDRKKKNQLLKYKIGIQTILIIFILLILAVPVYYYFYLN